jgi:hypothetical protein
LTASLLDGDDHIAKHSGRLSTCLGQQGLHLQRSRLRLRRVRGEVVEAVGDLVLLGLAQTLKLVRQLLRRRVEAVAAEVRRYASQYWSFTYRKH